VLEKNQSQTGFTLIELLIVMTISIMLLLTASTLFLTLLIGNTKTNSAQLVKSEGTAAMNQIEFLLRNAVEIPTCVASANEFTFRSLDGGTTTLEATLDSNDNKYKISSNSAFLTSGSLDLIGGANGLAFTCIQSADGISKYVTTSFTLRKGVPGVDQARDIVQETFSAGINMRSN
jgi:prepilin-type N-terminal cleavage/methylation domain-containing protein